MLRSGRFVLNFFWNATIALRVNCIFCNLACVNMFTVLVSGAGQRITAEGALNHPWFREEPLAKAKDAMPAYPPRSKHDRYVVL